MKESNEINLSKKNFIDIYAICTGIKVEQLKKEQIFSNLENFFLLYKGRLKYLKNNIVDSEIDDFFYDKKENLRIDISRLKYLGDYHNIISILELFTILTFRIERQKKLVEAKIEDSITGVIIGNVNVFDQQIGNILKEFERDSQLYYDIKITEPLTLKCDCGKGHTVLIIKDTQDLARLLGLSGYYCKGCKRNYPQKYLLDFLKGSKIDLVEL